MKKILLNISLAMLLGGAANAQQQSITALLAKMPAKNTAEFNNNAKDIAALGQKGITELLLKLVPSGQADNTPVFDAISGFSFYVTQPGREEWRKMAVAAYANALPKITDKENQAFVISQLQMVGKDDAVPALKQYLGDERLCDPAARALVKVNTPSSKAALLQALKGSQGKCKLSIVEALGDSKNKAAVKSLTALIGTDKNLNKTAMYALANIADPSSINFFMAQAQKSKYTYDETDATSACLLYIKNLGNGPSKASAVTVAKTLLTKASLANQVHTRTAALKLLVDMQGAKSMPLLMEAVKDNNDEYRAAALKFSAPYLNPTTTTAWIQEMKKAQPAEKAAIITMLGNNRVASALPAITQELKSQDGQVKIAAITASGKIGQDKVLPNLLDVLKTGSADDIAAVKNALLVMKGSNIPQQVAAALPTVPADAQVALISVLSARAAHQQINAVTPLLNSDSPNVKMAAYSSLKSLAGEDNLPALFSQLASSTQPEATTEVQAAIINVVSHSSNKSALTPMVLSQMQQAPADKKRLYFAILASIGDKQSLAAVTNAFDQGDNATKQAALAALSQWANVTSANELFKISSENSDPTIQDMALQGFVKTISKSDYPADEKLIFFRNAMDIAKTVSQKRMILRQVESCKTFPALIFAGKYLDDADLQADAANDVMSIALSNKAFYGNIVRDLLNKTILSMKGTDSDYLKEAIRKFLAEMPQDAGFVALFNDKDLTGWKGLVADPIKRSKMDAQTLAQEQQKADDIMRKGWYVKDGILNFSGEGENICTTKQYGDFDMYVDWKILKKGDAGIYLRGSPQVQIWDTSRVDVGAQVGSGGLYNNKPHESRPLKLADNSIGEWNSFHIVMKGDKVTVWLNGVLVVDNVVMDNYWDRSLPIFTKEQIELQAHGNHVFYRDIYLRELTDQENITKN